MLSEELTRLKQELKQILPEEGTHTVIKALKGHIPTDVPKYNALLQIEARLNEANLKRIKGILSEEQLQLQYNQLREDLLHFVDALRPEDFSKELAKKSKTGSVLYQVPKKMELQKRSKCIVRLAYEESVIIQNIELTADTSLKSVRISEAMEVALIDPGGGSNFSIQSISSPEQFLEEDEYSEWLFYVTPLSVGSHPLIVKVSVIELIQGKERKKEIVLEEIVTIVTQPVKEEEVAKPFQNAGYSFAFSSTAILDQPEQQHARPSIIPPAAQAAVRKYGMVLGAFTMLVVVSWAFGLFEFIYWQEAQWRDKVERYEAFMSKYPDGPYFNLAKQHRDLKVAVQQQSDSLLVEFLADYPGSELEEKAKSAYYQISTDNLDKRVKDRKARKAKEHNKGAATSGNNKEARNPPKEKVTAPTEVDPNTPVAPQEEEPGNTGSEVTDPVMDADKPMDQKFMDGIPKSQDDPGVKVVSTKEDLEIPSNIAGTSFNNFPKPEKIAEAISWLESNMVNIEGGRFMMGCDASMGGCSDYNVPQREVKVNSFQLCRYEVTQVLWQSIMGYNPSYVEVRNCAMCPVEYVSFRDAQEFIKKLNKKTGKKYRLPTEAEWEYAARGGKNATNTVYAGSDKVEEVGWFQTNSRRRPQIVGKKKPNSLGIFDMSGGVFEWCEDTWHSNFEKAPSNANAWIKKGMESNRVIRGGSWLDDPTYLRVDYRDMDIDSLRNHITGFRLAR